jgi:hypothetical protein
VSLIIPYLNLRRYYQYSMEFLTFIGLFTIVNGFLLDDKLPQYNRYGRSLILVGGNLYDNNTEIYQAIVRFAVSIRGKLVFFYFFFGVAKSPIGLICFINFTINIWFTIRLRSETLQYRLIIMMIIINRVVCFTIRAPQMDIQSAPSIFFSDFRISRCFV